MEIFKTSECLPEGCIENGEYEVWWFNSHEFSWALGCAMFMDFDEFETRQKYTHWAHSDQISLPDGIE